MDNTKVTQFSTGAIRDSQDGKPDFIETHSYLADIRYAKYMTAKKKKYGSGNFKKGIPQESYLQSMARHFNKIMAIEECRMRGIEPPAELEASEDHWAAIRFNVDGWMHEDELNKIILSKKQQKDIDTTQIPILQ